MIPHRRQHLKLSMRDRGLSDIDLMQCPPQLRAMRWNALRPRMCPVCTAQVTNRRVRLWAVYTCHRCGNRLCHFPAIENLMRDMPIRSTTTSKEKTS